MMKTTFAFAKLRHVALLLLLLFSPLAAAAQSTPYGDVNHDGEVTVADVNYVIDIILGGDGDHQAADVNHDGEVTIADINAIIEVILGRVHQHWYLVTDQDQAIAMSRVAALTAVDKYTEIFKVLDKNGNVLADQVKKVTFEFLVDAIAHENYNHSMTVRSPKQDENSIPSHKFLLSYQQDNEVFHESPEMVTFQTDGNGHFSWNSSSSTTYNTAHDISFLDYVVRSAMSSVKLPDDAPVSPDDIYIVGNDGYAIDVQQDGTFTTVADYLVALDNNGNTLYLAYANSDVNDNMQVVTMDSRETALALVLPILPNIFETMPQEYLNKLKDIFWDVPEVKALARAIDESIVNKGYLDMDYVDNAYQTAYNRLIVLLHLDTTYLSGGSAQSRGNGMEVPHQAKAPVDESTPATAPQQTPQTPLVVYPYNQGIQLLLNDARYVITEATPPVEDVMTAAKYIWQCDFELRNSNSFAYTSVMQGRLGPGGEWFNYVYDVPYETAVFLNILKAQKVSSFLETFTSLSGIEDLGNFFEETWQLLTDSEYFFDEMTWDQEIKKVTFNMTTYDDIVVVAGPRDNNYVLSYNILKVAVEPILKMAAKKLLKGLGDTKFEEKILIPFLSDFFFKMATDAELKAKYESIVYDQSLSSATKLKNVAELMWPKLLDFLKSEFLKTTDKGIKDGIRQFFNDMANDFEDGNYDNVVLTDTELSNFATENSWAKVEKIFKWLDIIEKVGDATTGFMGLFEANRTYEINLDFGDQLILSDYNVVMPPDEKVVHIEMGKRVYDVENDNPALISVEKSPGIKGTYLRITRNDDNLTGHATITVTDRLLNKQALIHVTVGSSDDRLYIEQQSLDLGDTPIGGIHTGELTIVNNCVSPQTVTVEVTSPFSIAHNESSMSSLTVEVAPNSCYPVTIMFPALSEGDYLGTATFTSNAIEGGSITVPLHGHAVSGQPSSLAVSTTEIDFGVVKLGTDQQKTLTVTNTSDASVTFKVDASTMYTGRFEVSDNLEEVTLASGDSKIYTVTSHGQESGYDFYTEVYVIHQSGDTAATVKLLSIGDDDKPLIGQTSLILSVGESATVHAKTSHLTSEADVEGIVDYFGHSDATGGGRIDGHHSISTQSSLDITFRGLKAGVTTITFRHELTGETATLKITVFGADDNHEWVDLGLPSGTLWATCNVGANAPEEYGDYFAWGETAPKDYYAWSTYKWCNGSKRTMTKYCTKSSYGYNGFTDGKTELDPEDDAAYVNWGPSWRMPTHEQQRELYEKCSSVWTMQNGVNGRLFTGPNGNTLFLPAAGRRLYASLANAGSWGRYWSRTLLGGLPHEAFHLGFDSDVVYWGYERHRGFTVRAVRVSQN